MLVACAVTPVEAAFPFAPPETVIAESSVGNWEDPLVPTTYQAVYLCLARAAKEATLTRVKCVVTDSSGSGPIVREIQLNGPFALWPGESAGIVPPATVCATAWALYDIDGHAVEVEDGPECQPVGPS